MFAENLKTRKKYFENLKNLGIFTSLLFGDFKKEIFKMALIVVGVLLILSMNVDAYYVQMGVAGDPTGTCYCYNCSDCENALNDNANCSSNVKLNASITNQRSCIYNPANFSNKIFDCQGHTIDGVHSYGTRGIYLNGKQNNTIKNCIITGFRFGIYLNSSSNNTLISNTLNNNSVLYYYWFLAFGIYLESSSNNTITNNIVNNNTGDGIHLSYSSNNTITNNIVNNNEHGIYLDDSSNNNLITNNTANNNNGYGYGIYLFYSSNGIVNLI